MPQTNDTKRIAFSHSIGNAAVFCYPVSVSVDADDNIFVVNRGHDGDWVFGVNKLTIDEFEIGKFGGDGESDGRFVWPTAIVVDSAGLAYVADEWLNRISVYDTTVQFNGEDIEEKNFLRKWGVSGSRPGELDAPAGLALDADENLLIAEQKNHRISKYTRDGEFLGAFADYGDGDGQLNKPWGIAIDGAGDVYVADWGNHRVQKFTADGEYLGAIGQEGYGPGRLRFPSDVAVDADGDVYVTDWGQNKVEVYNDAGDHVTSLYGDAVELSPRSVEYLRHNVADNEKRQLVTDFEPERHFLLPTSVTVDSKGRVIIVDNIRFRLQIYHKPE